MIFSFPKRSLALLLTFCVFPSIFAAETFTKEATYYADAFQWLRTANGDTFDQNAYSAAMCDVPLDSTSMFHTEILELWSISMIVQIVLILIYSWSEYCSIQKILHSQRSEGLMACKWHLWVQHRLTVRNHFSSSDTFQHLSITLTNQIPTILFEWY